MTSYLLRTSDDSWEVEMYASDDGQHSYLVRRLKAAGPAPARATSDWLVHTLFEVYTLVGDAFDSLVAVTPSRTDDEDAHRR